MAATALATETYGLKYRGGFHSPMREKLSYDVYISERGYSGQIYDLPLTGDCVVISQGSVDDPETKAFKPSIATLSVLCREDTNPYLSLYTLDPTRYKVFIGECRESEGVGVCLIRWAGYISTGMYSQPNAKAPYTVTIECNDGLEILKNTPYALADGTRYTDTLSVRELILRLLEPIEGGVELWDYMPIGPDQVENTFDLVSLTSASVYSAVGGEDTPSHYAVLEAVLTNFGLQLFQRYGSWCVRALPALASAVRPEWYNDIPEAYSLSGASFAPLYDDNGGREGLSTSANLSMLPPLREINISAEARSDIPLDIYNPRGWKFESIRNAHELTVQRGTAGVRFESWGILRNFPTVFTYYDLPGVATASSNIEISLTANLYNLKNQGCKVRIGLLAIEVGLEELFDGRDVINNRIKALGKVAGWNASAQRWDTIKTDDYSNARELFSAITTEVSLTKSKRTISMAQKVSLSTLATASLSIEAVGYPDIGASEMRIAVLVAPAANSDVWYIPRFELADAELSITTASGAAGEEKARNIKVSHWGSESIELKESFVSGIADTGGRGIFAPILARIDSGAPVRAFINPSQRSTATEAIAGRLRAMRNDVTLDITGEVYKAMPIDLNTVWRSRDKRFFYANAITWLLKRGVYDMQLRELLPMRSVPTVNVGNASWSGYCSLDNGVIYRTPTSGSIYHLAPISGEEKLILSTTNDTRINEGYLCASVVEIVDSATNHYRLYAYDDEGKLLSYVNDLYSAFDAPSSETTDPAMEMALSARFDAATASWILVARVPLDGLWIVMLDVGGALLGKKAWANFLALSATNPLVVFNGGFAVNEERDGGYRIWWHSTALHEELHLQLFAEGAARVLAINDCFVAYQSTNSCSIYHRTGNGLTTADAPVYRADSIWSFVAMNNALILFRNTAGDALVFDVRTGAEIPIEATRLAPRYALCGDIVYVLGDPEQGALRGVRIIEGDGYYGAIDADGAELYDASFSRLMVKKYDI